MLTQRVVQQLTEIVSSPFTVKEVVAWHQSREYSSQSLWLRYLMMIVLTYRQALRDNNEHIPFGHYQFERLDAAAEQVI